MIRIVKPATPPVVLTTTGATARQRHCIEYEAAPDEYQSGTRTFTFDDVYRAGAVKDALRVAQHSKCAFCESLFTHIEYGDIEHYRPKAGYKQRDSDALRRPGYYWLAYEWSNLFYSCQLCNQRFKGNVFPLKDGRRRTRSHTESLSKEEPLLVNPAEQDPTAFIDFHNEYAIAAGGCAEGVATIDVLGLNRAELVEYRRRRFQDLAILRRLCEALRESVAAHPTIERQTELQEYEAELQSRLTDTAEYAGMARAYLR